MNLYIYSYNNYYNRMVKKAGDNIDDYADYLHYGPVQGVYGFTPGDGINTTQLIGTNAMVYDGKGNYLIAHNPETDEIDSRWFIIDCNRTRNGQWQLTLHRDLVVDYYDIIVKSPMFVEKATLDDTDPMIWNPENIQTNKIKTGEWQIQDKTKCAWIVGFLDREYAGNETLSINITDPPILRSYDVPLEQTDIYQDRSAYYTSDHKIELYVKANLYGDYIPYRVTLSSTNPNNWTYAQILETDYTASGSTLISQGVRTIDTIVKNLNSLNLQKILDVAYNTYIYYKGDQSEFVSLSLLNGSTISCQETPSTKQNYNISCSVMENGTTTYSISSDLTKIDGKNALRTYILDAVGTYSGQGGLKVVATQPSISLIFTPQQIATFDFKIAAKNSRRILNDAPYDMFCIPYGDIELNRNDWGFSGNSLSKLASLSFAQQIAEKLSSNLFDLQLLPYCPFTDLDVDYYSNGRPLIHLDSLTENRDYTYTEVGIGEYAIMFYPTTSSGDLNENQLYIHKWNASNEYESTISTQKSVITTTDNKKIANQCDMYRLCSPNWNGQFEFNIAKFSNGWQGIRVDYTYLPYSSYIHVNPVFSGLYGEDFDDARGLICQGDFSVSYESDKWESYQVQNKNYANIFNRQIQNMEVNQNVQRNQQVFNAITGTLMGGAGGALAGSKAGPYGAIAGAIVGTAASAIGGALDVQYGDILRNEALDYTKDMFNYQLENIQALPDSIAKVTAYTKNNKLFPTLEYYTCTPEEKQAVANKIAWNGMTVMRIDTMSNFISNKWSYKGIESKGYIKGKLIRLEFVEEGIDQPHKEGVHSEDYHVVNAIAGELDKGVYIKG